MLSSSPFALSGWREGGLFVLSFGIFSLLCYRSRKQKQLDHENPRVQGIMRREAHVDLGAFVSEVEARNFVLQPHCSPYVITLDQAWQFNLFPSYQEAISAMHLGIAHKDAVFIEVPGHWQMQNAGDTPLYTNVKYTIPVTPPHVPTNNPTGYYRKYFKVSKSWQQRAILLNFGAVDSAFYLYINEVSVGFSKDSRLPAEFEITDYIQFEHENLLEVIVVKYSDGHYLEDQDMWHLSGIFREVLLYSLPQPVHIGDFKWNVAVDYTMQVATVDIDVKLHWDLHALQSIHGDDGFELSSHASHLSSDWIVSTALYEEGQLAYSAVSSDNSHLLVFDQSKDDAICRSEAYAVPPQASSILSRTPVERCAGYVTTSVTSSHMIVSPALWCPEYPNVYTLVICVKSATDGTIVQAESCRVGIRTIDIIEGHLRINQRSILVRGVNLHEHDPFRGHFASRRLIEADIRLMKRNNFNAVRTSHYPHSSWFYELCTLYGLYVVDEANIETHGMIPYAGRLADDSDWESAYLQRVDRMIERDKNHACIIVWSLGNEGGYGKAHDKLAQWVRKKDPSRKVMYEPASYGQRLVTNSNNASTAAANAAKNLATDILCPMYARVDDCIIMGNRYPDLPLILCEYSHMMGNSGGNLSDYWTAFIVHSRLQGGFIWDWVDQGIAAKNARGDYIWAYGGDFGESQHDSAFCLNGLNWPDRGFGRNVLLCDLGRVMGKKKLLREQAHSYGLACPFTSKQGLKDRGLSAAAALKDDTLPVLEAMAKPQLLEAKQSMKVFQCTITELRSREVKLEPINASVAHSTSRGPPITKRRASGAGEAIRMTVRYSILNLMDHVSDLRDYLNFEAILLCDGLIVAATSLQLPEDRILSRKHLSYEDDDSRQSYQELEGFAKFVVPVKRATTTSEVLHRYSSLPDLRASLLGRRIVRGIPWPETYLLSPFSFKDVNETIEMSNDGHAMWSVVSKFSHWSVVTIGRLANHTVWASKGFPVGFSQNPITVNLKTPLSRASMEFGGLRANMPMQTYRSPRDERPRGPLLRSQSSNGESEAHEVYDVRVTWGRDINGNCTIVLNGDLKPDVYFSTPEFPGRIEAVVSASTGYLLKYRADGVDMLASEVDIGDVTIPPSRFQVHRAATDNDRGGYLGAWKVAGMEGMLHHVRNIVPQKLHVDGSYSPRANDGDDTPQSRDVGEPIIGKHIFECVSVEHIFMRGDDRDRGEGVQCTWEMAPSQLDKGKLRILNHIISFVQHGNAGTTLVEVFSNDQERFAHEIAATYMLGRKTIVGRNECLSGVYMAEKKTSVKIKLIKRHTYIVTTIPAVEKLVLGPLGCLIDDTLPGDLTSSLDDLPVVSWNVSYIITQRGALLVRAEVDASAMPCSLPRVGMQMNLKNDFHRALWFGQGPHECYPDREASVVKAVHRATIDSLQVPYIVPCENAARGSIDWLRLDYKYTPPTPLLSGSNSTSDFSFSQPGTPVPPPPSYSTPMVVSKFDDLQLLNVTSPVNTRRMASLSPALTPQTNSENEATQPVVYSMVVRCCQPFHFSTLRHTIEDLSAAQHTYELENSIRPFVCLNIDPYIMGVGGDDSWSACVHDEFLLPPAKYSFQLALSIFRS